MGGRSARFERIENSKSAGLCRARLVVAQCGES